MRELPSVPVLTEFVGFAGGLDLVTPPLQLKSGFCRDAENFECDINGGYATIQGYECFDGQPAPSDAAYAVLTCTFDGSPVVAVGDVLTDNAGTSYGTVIALTATTAVLTKITGAWGTPGNIKVGADVVGTFTDPPVTDGASTPALAASYKNLAADVYRALIAAVPGSGNVLGVWLYEDVVYAWRNNAGATAADLYKSTASGWSQVALGREINFTSGGTYVIAEGDTITGATSGATAVITRVVLEGGSWAAGTAAGRLIFATDTGTFQAENLNVGANLNVATIAGDSSAITMLPGGRFEHINANFSNVADDFRVYGCDGINRAFEFDGTVFVPIDTGASIDTPRHLAAHNNRLVLAILNNVLVSEAGDPYFWDAATGTAFSFAVEEDVTALSTQPGSTSGGALAVFSRNAISVLYGNDNTDSQMTPFKSGVGAIRYSVQRVQDSIFLDDRGLSTLKASQNYGNFADATFSQRIQTWLNTRKVSVTGSCIVRDKSQYRIFFSDSYGLYVTFNGNKVVGMMPVLFSDQVKCICSEESTTGAEKIYFGSTDGFVYQLDKGTSFDGDAITTRLWLAFNSSGTPRQKKRYRRAQFEVTGSGYASFSFSFDLGYGTTDITQPGNVTLEANLSSGRWDTGTWDVGFWDGRTLIPNVTDMRGSAENVSLKLSSSSDYFYPLRHSGVLMHYSHRRQLR